MLKPNYTKEIFSACGVNTTLGFSHGFLKNYLTSKGEDFPKKTKCSYDGTKRDGSNS